MSEIFEGLAEPHRRQIVELLRIRERSVGEIVEAMGISQPAVSKHLRILKEAGLVDVQPDAQKRIYRLRLEPLIELDAWLASYRSLWEARLDRLEAYLRKLQDEQASTQSAGASAEEALSEETSTDRASRRLSHGASD